MAFRLIKTYPNSPKLGTQIDTTDGAVQVGILGTMNLKEHPEYWEEIKPEEPLDYEVLSYQRKDDHQVITIKRDNGLFLNRLSSGNGVYEEIVYKQSENWNIYSVKRLSDGEIFTVGDTTTEGNILEFDLPGSTKTILRYKIDESGKGWRDISKAVKTDFQILSLKCKNHDNPYILHENGLYGFESGKDFAKLDVVLTNGTFNIIHSVKRLSDGEIFTIGDSVQYYVPSYWDEESVSNITGFKICNPKNLIIKTTTSSKWAFLSDTIRKVKQPIFITSDGVEMFEGDTYSWVEINNVTLATHNCTTNSSSGQNPQYIYFSTKEKADRYIDQNKKIYSKQDLINILSSGKGIVGISIWD